VARIDVRWRLLASLRRHSGGIGLAGLSARPKLGPLHVVFGQPRPAVVKLTVFARKEVVHE
jgi:hypothetical protein